MSEHTISARGSRSLDETPWSEGTGFSVTDWKKLDKSLVRFWGNTQLAYSGGKLIRTSLERNKPSKTLFDVIWNPKKKK